ncbi:GlxA family transcriptional regulator [Jannaschia sp. W003]|uniref:GlxA family transcriptional regulator n=1 Tax=Jannaschia sp. W003 TaxID=2867012 RepID=UPI0021A65B17|nr:GlxA family transcriptional regulator [Jannaschia sp. W003]UWQ20596.1 GlxA family transcriptional regulator [Jannaschia sp. W003]
MPEPSRHFTFALMRDFTLVSFACAVDTLRLANHMAEAAPYSWDVVGEGGGAARSSSGVEVALDGPLGELRRDAVLVVVGGTDIRAATSRPLLSWLRREARRGGPVAGLCTAAWPMAEAGLIDGRRATIHWENADGFAEAFPDVDLTGGIYTIDGRWMTTAGGTASVDLFLKLISDDMGEGFATAVADQLIYSSIRTDRDSQRLSIPTRIGVRHPRLGTVIRAMEENIEEPVSPAILAERVGMSTRQLERLFRRYLNRSPKRYYMELRLARARNLLMQTDLSIIEVALACGFTSPSHFSKCYRAQYGTTPYRERGTRQTPGEERPTRP